MKLLKLHSKDEAADLTKLSDVMPFSDNGGEPDGNAWLIPLEDCPQQVLDNLDTFGVVVDGERVEYVATEELDEDGEPTGDEEWPEFGGEWMGMQMDQFAYVVR